jgi:hypothetical protein
MDGFGVWAFTYPFGFEFGLSVGIYGLRIKSEMFHGVLLMDLESWRRSDVRDGYTNI